MPLLDSVRAVWRWFWSAGDADRPFDWLTECIWCYGALPQTAPAIPLVSPTGQLVPEQACSRECAGAFYRERRERATGMAERRADAQRFYADWLSVAVAADARRNGAAHHGS